MIAGCHPLFYRLVFIGAWLTSSIAQSETMPEVVLRDLDKPCGLAIQPETSRLFVADSGRGRIVRLVDGRLEEVAVGFPKGAFRADRSLEVGPLGIAFLNPQLLVVGGTGLPIGENVLYLIEVPAEGQPAVAADKAVRLGPIVAEGDLPALGDFASLATANEMLYVTAHGSDDSSWIIEFELKHPEKLSRREGYGQPQRLIATDDKLSSANLLGLAVSPRGELVLGMSSSWSEAQDSVIGFCRSTDGKPLLRLSTRLQDIVGLGYTGLAVSDRSSIQLYAIDFAKAQPSAGGLFRLDAVLKNGHPDVDAIRIATLDKPTSMTFDANGAIYVSVIGTATPGASEVPGQVLRFDIRP